METTPVRHGVEKGIDVALATQLIIGAMLDEYHVAVIVSGDNDFLTAIPKVRGLNRRVEVAGWRSSAGHIPGAMMRVPADVRRHSMGHASFVRVADDPEGTGRFLKTVHRPTARRQALIHDGLLRPGGVTSAAA